NLYSTTADHVDPETVVAAWAKSKPHRAAMLSPTALYAGGGIESDGTKTVVALRLGLTNTGLAWRRLSRRSRPPARVPGTPAPPHAAPARGRRRGRGRRRRPRTTARRPTARRPHRRAGPAAALAPARRHRRAGRGRSTC